jgi:tetratricopeptide (TPR) repeat protein
MQAQRRAALALEQQGRNTEAEAAWHALLKSQPRDPEPMAHIALLEARQGHYKEAIPYYRRALAINASVPGLRLNLALALFKSDDLAHAVEQFQILLRNAHPNSPEAQRYTILIGMSYYGLADYAKAAPYLQRAVDRDATSMPLLYALAQSYLWARQFSRVLDVYHQMLVLNPDSAEADMLAGEALDEMKDNEGSTRMFRAAIKADPKEPNVHFGLGYLLWTQKHYPEAASEFQAELDLNPAHQQARLYLADCDIQMNRAAEAQPLLEEVAKADPTLGLAHLDLGILYTDTNRNEDALRELTMASKQIPNNVNVHWRLARLYRTLGKKEEATAEFEKASKLNKEADEDLFKKIANGQHPHADTAPAPAAPQ